MINTSNKSNLERSQPILEGSQSRKLKELSSNRRTSRSGVMKNAVHRTCFQARVQLRSYAALAHLPRDSAAQGGLGPPTSIGSRTWPTDRPIGQSDGDISSAGIPRCVKLITKISHHTVSVITMSTTEVLLVAAVVVGLWVDVPFGDICHLSIQMRLVTLMKMIIIKIRVMIL